MCSFFFPESQNWVHNFFLGTHLSLHTTLTYTFESKFGKAGKKTRNCKLIAHTFPFCATYKCLTNPNVFEISMQKGWVLAFLFASINPTNHQVTKPTFKIWQVISVIASKKWSDKRQDAIQISDKSQYVYFAFRVMSLAFRSHWTRYVGFYISRITGC